MSGGNWMASLPLSNLQNRRLSRVARSTDASDASTKFDIDLAQARRIRVVALVAHNLSTSATVRIIGDDENTFATPLYDSGAVPMWPAGTIPQDLLEWEDDNFWLGTVSQQAVAGYQAPFICVLPAAVIARYWRVEISDTGNSDGWVHIGRLYIADAWQPKHGMRPGVGLGFGDASAVDASLTGEEFFEPRRKRRTLSFDLPAMSVTEGYQFALEIDRMAGVTGEVLVIPDPSDSENGVRRNFLGRLQSLPALLHSSKRIMSKKYEITEIL